MGVMGVIDDCYYSDCYAIAIAMIAVDCLPWIDVIDMMRGVFWTIK
jgi:hypothetical protein